MKAIKELLESGRVVVAKTGEPATPEQLAEAVLQYCEAAGYTVGDVRDLVLKLSYELTGNERKLQQQTKFSINTLEDVPQDGNNVQGITIDLSNHDTQRATKASK